MADHSGDANQGRRDDLFTRRGFLHSAMGAAAAACAPGALQGMAAAPGFVKANAAARTGDSQPSIVARIASNQLPEGGAIPPLLMHEAVTLGLCLLTDHDDVRDAWHSILSPDDVVLLKFNQSGAEELGTTPPMVQELLASLGRAGWGPQQVIVLEGGSRIGELRQTLRPDYRFPGRRIRFGRSGRDSFVAAIEQATAIVNVAFLKTHHLATMTGCLKNLSHGLIRHPSNFHTNGCDPAIGEIVASEPIRSRLRLNIVNGLRVVFDKGPEVSPATIHPAGFLLFGRDPVACDAVGFAALNSARSLRGIGPLRSGAELPRHLATAAKLGLGQADIDKIVINNIAI